MVWGKECILCFQKISYWIGNVFVWKGLLASMHTRQSNHAIHDEIQNT